MEISERAFISSLLFTQFLHQLFPEEGGQVESTLMSSAYILISASMWKKPTFHLESQSYRCLFWSVITKPG